MLAGPALSSGAVYLWDAGDGTDDNWTTPANWESDIVPIDDGTAEVIFAEGDGLVEVDVARNVAAIAGNNPFNGTLIYGQQVTVGAGGIVCNDSAGLEMTASVVLNANQTFNAADGPLAFDILHLGPYTLSIAGGSDVYCISSVVEGAGSISKTGTGYLFLNGLLHFSALTTSAGTTVLESPLPGATITNNGGTLSLEANNTNSTLNANSGTTSISDDQTLVGLNIGGSAVVSIHGSTPAQAIPEPDVVGLLSAGALCFLGKCRWARRRAILHRHRPPR